MITVTNNYFADLDAAVASGAIVRKGSRNPSKADLYAAIEAHNASIQGEPTADELLALDAAEDAAKAAEIEAKKPAKKMPTVAKSSKMQQFTEAVLAGATDAELMELTGWKLQGVKGWKGVVLSRHGQQVAS